MRHELRWLTKLYFLKSKVLWLNVLGFAVELLALPQFVAIIPQVYAGPVALAVAVGNMILRMQGGAPITMSLKP